MHHQSLNRRALLEITRDRFPVQARPFIRVLRSLSATGGFQGLEGYVQERELDYNRGGSASAVYHYFDALPSYAITIPSDDKPDLKALFEMRNTTAGLVYSNNRPLRLPGGSILPARSQGTVISDGDARSPVVVMWQHKHSGWKFALALLKDYVKRRQIAAGGPRNKLVPSITLPTAANSSKAVDLRFEDIGVEEGLGNQELITDILELFRSVLRNNHTLTPFLMQALLPEDDADLSGWERASLLEVIPLLLQDVLHTTSVGAGPAPTRLVTNILGVMTTLLPHHPGSLWTSLRSSTLLFGDVRRAGSTPALLSFERTTGSYPMTLALLDLVRALFDESVRTMYQVPPSFSTMKTEVLLRALAFLHNEIWIDFNNWKYTNLGQKFQIGSKIAVLFAETLTQAPSFPLESESRASPDDAHSTLLAVARFAMTAFFTQSIASTINPLVLVIASGHMTREALYRARRFSDAHYLDGFVESSLLLCRLVLVRKATVTTTKPSLLEQGLFVGLSAGALALDHHRPRLNPVDTIASHYVRPPNGIKIQLEAVKLLTALCVSVSKCQPSPPSMLGHLSNAESVVDFLLKIVHNADDEPAMRLAVWSFISAAIDTQPALATFFLSGKASSSPVDQTSGSSAAAGPRVPSVTAIDAADQTIQRWKTLSEQNPALLASTLSFLDLVWQHAHEHTNVIESLRKNHGLWKEFSELVKEKQDIPPTTEVKDMMEIDGLRRSGLHEVVSNHAYFTMSKAHVIHLIALDLTLPRQPPSEPGVSSLSIVTELFENPDRLSKILSEAIFNPFDATLHEQTRESLESLFPNFTLESIRAVALLDRVFGDDYIFPSLIVEERLHQYAVGDAELQKHRLKVYKGILSLNLDWSLIDSYISLTRSWSVLLHGVTPVLRERKPSQQSMLSAASSVATAIAQETRSGPVAVAVHAERLRLLLGLFDATWLYAPTFEEVIKLMAPIQALVSHEVHRPIHSVSGVITPSFHQSLLQLIYYCTRKVRMIGLNTSPAVKRSIVTSTVTAALQFVIEALRSVFEQAHEVNSDILDEDMQLLVATFEECIRTELGASQSLWLSQLQSASLIRSSLELLAKVDIAGVQQPSILRLRRYPYYARHILQFHLALATLPASAERLAHEGVMVCYVSNTLTPVLETGGVDVTHVAHHSWCTIVAIVTALTCVLGTGNGHFVNAEIVGFVQLYGAQLTKVLSWKVGDSLTIPLLQEMEAVVLFFHAIATSMSSRPHPDHGALDILRAYGERALFLLQQLNSALSYPNQLSSSLEPLSAVEQTLFEKESDLGRVGSSIDFLDNGTRPILASVVQKLIMSASTILSTLAITSGSDKILTRSESVPSTDILLISPVRFQDYCLQLIRAHKPAFLEFKSLTRRTCYHRYFN
jgi:nuclear pore complex protein Nup188